MRKIGLLFLSPVLVAYLGYGIAYYVRKKDDVHFATLNDIVSWFLE
jgi:hypothetical protein